MVGMVNATDIDKRGTDHTKIRYSLLSGTNLFYINPETGVISTKTDTLDREVSPIVVPFTKISHLQFSRVPRC